MIDRNEALIISFNGEVMEDLAYRYVFGREVDQDLRAVLRWILVLQHRFDRVPTMELREAVAAAIGTGTAVARERMHEVEYRGYAGSKQGDLGNELLWNFKPGWRENWLEVQRLRLQIAEVVRRQLADPTNPAAGAELVPGQVYYNAIADERLKPADITDIRNRKKQHMKQFTEELVS
jgi:hypothetical protein